MSILTKDPTIKRIIAAVEEIAELEPGTLRSPCRMREISDARHLAMYAARELTGASFPMIGREFLKDHSSVIHAVKRIGGMPIRTERMEQIVNVLTREVDALRRSANG